MRILTGIDLPFIPSCGSLILCNDLYHEFLKQGHQVRFLALNSPHSPNWSTLSDVHLFDVGKATSENDYQEYIATLKCAVEKHVNDFRPDIIHIQHLGFGMALAFAAIPKIPKLGICHGTSILFSLNSSFHRRNLGYIASAVERIVFPSYSIYNNFLKLKCTDIEKEIVYWGIPEKVILESKTIMRKPDRKANKILFAGRLTTNKNAKVVVEAMNYLDDDITLTIFGDGDQKYAISKLIENLRLERRVFLNDFLPREKLWRKFGEFDAIVISTSEIEAFSLLAIEAQANGLPVVHSNTGALQEIIGVTGEIFNPMSARDLAYKIQNLFQNTTKLIAYVELGKKNASKYSIRLTVNRLTNISQSVISGSHHGDS